MKSYQAISSLERMDYMFKTIIDSIFHIIWKEGGNGGLCARVVAPLLSPVETHINSSQAQNFFAIEHGFSNHLCRSTKILNSQIKAIFHSQEGKGKAKPFEELSTLGHLYTQKNIRPWLLRIL